MKKLFLFSIACCISVLAFSQINISADSAANHIGENVTICSKVFGIKVLEKVTRINVGAAYPNSPLTVVIFEKDKGNFKDIEAMYADKNICVTGTIKEYKGKPEIVITKPNEIAIQ